MFRCAPRHLPQLQGNLCWTPCAGLGAQHKLLLMRCTHSLMYAIFFVFAWPPVCWACARPLISGLQSHPPVSTPRPPFYGGVTRCRACPVGGFATPHISRPMARARRLTDARTPAPTRCLVHHAPHGVAPAGGALGLTANGLRRVGTAPDCLWAPIRGVRCALGRLCRSGCSLHARVAGLRGIAPGRPGQRLAWCARAARYLLWSTLRGACLGLRRPARSVRPTLRATHTLRTVLGLTSSPLPPIHGGIGVLRTAWAAIRLASRPDPWSFSFVWRRFNRVNN